MKQITDLKIPLLLALTLLETTFVTSQTDFWKKLTRFGSAYSTLVLEPVFPRDGSIFVATYHDGTYRSTDGGNTWAPVDNEFINSEITSIAIDSLGYIYVGALTPTNPVVRVYRSTDNGEHWKSTGLQPDSYLMAIAVHGNGDIFAVSWFSIYQSTDHGGSWKKLSFTMNTLWTRCTMAINSNGYIFVSSLGSGVYVSEDTAKTWVRTRLPKGGLYNWILASDAQGHVFAGNTSLRGKDYVYRSSNGGKTWNVIYSKSPPPRMVPQLTSFVTDPRNNLYIGHSGLGVLRSTDRGRHWLQINSGLTPDFPATDIWSLALSPNGYLFAGTASGELFRSVEAVGAIAGNISSRGDENLVNASFTLLQNYPNPFNPTTTISFDLRQEALVTLKVYNTLGQEVRELVHNELMDEGEQELEFDASSLASGVYYYRIVAQDVEGSSVLFSNTKKMLLIK